MPQPPTLPAGLEALTAEVLRLKREGVGSVEEVEIFGSGLHRDDEPAWTREEIHAIHRNFQELSTGDDPRLGVMIGLDHIPGGPAVGRVTNLWLKPGGVLVSRFSDLPALWAEAIDLGIWDRISVEIDPEPPFGLPGEGPTLVGVTLLGAMRPQLKWTSHLKDRVRMAERRHLRPTRRRFRSTRLTRGHRVYSEAVMDRATLLQQLVDAGMPQTFVDQLGEAVTDDTALTQLVNAYLAAQAGAVPADGATAQEGMPRDQMIEEILKADPSQDRAALEAMDDAALQALLDQLAPGVYAEYQKANPATPTTPETPAVPPTTAVAPAAQPAAPTVPTTPITLTTPTTLPPALTAQFAELQKSARVAVETANKAAAAARGETLAARRYAERRERERWEQEIDAAVDAALACGALSPADDDDKNPAILPKRKKLRNLIGVRTGVHTYSANGKTVTKTQLEQALDELAAQTTQAKKGGRYSERIAAGGTQDSAAKAKYDAIRKQAADEYAARNAKPALTLEDRMGLMPSRHQR